MQSGREGYELASQEALHEEEQEGPREQEREGPEMVEEPNMEEDLRAEELVKNTLPKWAYQENAHFNLQTEVGPSVPWLRKSALLTQVTQVAIFVFLNVTLVCPDDAGIPQYSMTAWFIAFPAITFRLLTEFYALSLYLSSYAKAVIKANKKKDEYATEIHMFEVMGIKAVFIIWLAISFIFTVLNGIDIVTDTLFSATYYKGLQCPANRVLNQIWEETWKQSVMGRLGIPTCGLAILILLCWMICQFQGLVPIVDTFPKTPQEYTRGDVGGGLSITGKFLQHGKTFDELVEANGSCTLQTLATKSSFAQVMNSRGFPHAMTFFADAQVDNMMKRVWLSYNLENAIQANLQTTVFGIAFSQSMTLATYQSLFSIGLGMFLTSLKLADVMTVRKFSALVQKAYMTEEVASSRFGDSTKFWMKAKRVYLGFAVLVAALANAVVKLVAAFRCKDSMVNITGCVELHK